MRLEVVAKFAPVALGLVVFAFLPSYVASEDPQTSDDARSLLRGSRRFSPKHRKDPATQCGIQHFRATTRAGDLEGAILTVQAVESASGRAFAVGNIASMLAWRGNLPLSLDLIRNSATGNDWQKAQDYVFVAGQLAKRRDFEAALGVAA